MRFSQFTDIAEIKKKFRLNPDRLFYFLKINYFIVYPLN